MYYIIITQSVYSDNSLKDGAKVLYGLILSLSQKDGYCYADNTYLANTLNRDSRTIQLYLQELKKAQYIYVDILKNNVRRITTQDTRVRLTPIAKNAVEAKKTANNAVQKPEWLDDYITQLVKMD